MTTIAPTPAAPQTTGSAPMNFDDVFLVNFTQLTQGLEQNEGRKPSNRDRARFIKQAHLTTEAQFYPPGQILGPAERQQKALTRVLYNVMADKPWDDQYIRSPDVERKLSRFEWAPDSYALAEKHGFRIPVDAIRSARRELELQALQAEQTPQEEDGESKGKQKAVERFAPFDDIEVIYVPGTVSSDATNAINRNEIYTISVESVAYQLENHMCKNMTSPFEKARQILNAHTVEDLLEIRRHGQGIIDFAPHLLDNDNISLLIVLLIIPRNEICSRFSDNGIRIEGSTMSHRKSELMKHSLGWLTQEDKWGFDTAAMELQKRIKAVCAPKTGRTRPYRRPVGSAPTTSRVPNNYYLPQNHPENHPAYREAQRNLAAAYAAPRNGAAANGNATPTTASVPKPGVPSNAPAGYGGFYGHGGVGANYVPAKDEGARSPKYAV